MSTFLASLPNSRIKPRPSTRVATGSPNITVTTGPGNTQVAAANANRTYITIRNNDPTSSLRYDYFDNPTMSTTGFLLKANESEDLQSPQAIFAISVGAASVAVSVDEGSG